MFFFALFSTSNKVIYFYLFLHFFNNKSNGSVEWPTNERSTDELAGVCNGTVIRVDNGGLGLAYRPYAIVTTNA